MSFLNKLNFVLQLVFAVAVAAIADIAARRSRFSETHPKISRLEIIVVSFLATMIFYPAVKAVDIGQIQTWLDLAFALALLSWISGRRGCAGAILGFASTIKPQFGLLLIWGLLWRDWRFIVGYLIIAIPIGVVSLAEFGVHNNLEYLQVLSFISEHGEAYYPNNSVNGIANRLLFNGSADWFSGEFAPPNDIVLWTTRFAFVGFVVFGLKNALLHGRGMRPGAIDFGVVTLCAIMGSPIAWEHHYGIAMPLFVLAFFSAYRHGEVTIPIAIGLILSWSLAANYSDLIASLGKTHFNLLQAHLFLACMWLLWFLGTQRGDESAWLDQDGEAADQLRGHAN
jgi:alpha-1,2-mannosyltransferase